MAGAKLQLSMVLSQRSWPGVGDLDECWCLSTMQCVLACAPWSHLPGTDAFRQAAGDPDDGRRDGGSLAEIAKAVRQLWPAIGQRLAVWRGVTWDQLQAGVKGGHPVSVALTLGKLPPRLRYTTSDVPHQSTLAWRESTDSLVFANPMAPATSKWDSVTWAELRPSILDYGNGRVFGVRFPSADAMLDECPGFADAVAAGVQAELGTALDDAKRQGRASMQQDAVAAVQALTP